MSSCGVMVCECNGPRCVTRDVFCVSCKLSNTQKCINSRCRQSYYGSVTFMESPPFIIAAMHSSASISSIRRFVISEKAPTRAFSWLKMATTAFTFKTLLRHYAKQALTPWSLNVKLGPRRNYHKGRAAIRHYANQTARPL